MCFFGFVLKGVMLINVIYFWCKAINMFENNGNDFNKSRKFTLKFKSILNSSPIEQLSTVFGFSN